MTVNNSTVSPRNELRTLPDVHEITPESAAASPKPTLAADISTTNSAAVSSPPTASTDMAATQDPDAIFLPDRSSARESAPASTIDMNQPPQDPQVASLQSIFPDFDVAVLQSVLESVGGNQDRAIDMLLGMNDPNYVPQEQPGPVQSQTELDEEFARQLMLEDQQQQGWSPHPQGQQTPYQPRIRGRQQQQQGGVALQGGQQDTMGDIQEQFTKIADTGKKTFSSLFSKVKAKVQEFDQQRIGQSSAQTVTEPSWGSESTGGPPGSQSYYESQQAHVQPSYYDPNPQRQQSGAARTRTPGYDATPLLNSGSGPNPGVGYTSTPPPISTASGAPAIDPGKLGMLPKRPVSLLDPSAPGHRPDDDDDDDLEYAENPFEEHK